MKPQASCLDSERLLELHRDIGGDKEFFVSLAETYRIQVSEFQAAARTATPEELADLAHRMAGSCFSVANSTIVKSVAELESTLRAGQPHADKLATVVDCLPEVVEQFELWANSLPEAH